MSRLTNLFASSSINLNRPRIPNWDKYGRNFIAGNRILRPSSVVINTVDEEPEYNF